MDTLEELLDWLLNANGSVGILGMTSDALLMRCHEFDYSQTTDDFKSGS
jgi:hypothetical protein